VFTQLCGHVFAYLLVSMDLHIYSTVYVGTTRADAESRDDMDDVDMGFFFTKSCRYVFAPLHICSWMYICTFTQLCKQV